MCQELGYASSGAAGAPVIYHALWFPKTKKGKGIKMTRESFPVFVITLKFTEIKWDAEASLKIPSLLFKEDFAVKSLFCQNPTF